MTRNDPHAAAGGTHEAPVLVAGIRRACWRDQAGEIEFLSFAEVPRRLATGPPPVLCHAPATARRLDMPRFPALDLLELFAFVRPACFCLPTARGLAAALELPIPRTLEEEADTLAAAAKALLSEVASSGPERDTDVWHLADIMAAEGWPWGKAVLGAAPAASAKPAHEKGAPPARALEVWHRLKEWEEYPPEPAPGQAAVEPDEATARLEELLGADAEARPQQRQYAAAVTEAFLPRERKDEPRLVLAEAGTGIGKTLAYLAPASLWAQKNSAPVWISTFTRNLQHQIDHELDRLYREPGSKAAKVVIRKGRENYLCLLNLEEAVRALPVRPPASRERDATALGLFARWAATTRDGDMMGGDFPAWLFDLLARNRCLGLADRRGECIYSSCPHFKKCFIERSVRRARRAEIVIANHALVMMQAALGGGVDGDPYLPSRYVFDEGHHVFDAADSTFSAHLSGQEMLELRRWILGAEDRNTSFLASRMRGLSRRLGDIAETDEEAAAALQNTLRAARALPSEGWLERLNRSTAQGPAEAFLALVRQQVYARANHPSNAYSLETETKPGVGGLSEAAAALEVALAALSGPLSALGGRLSDLLDERTAELGTSDRLRVEAMCRGLARRAETQVDAWRSMLRSLETGTPSEFVDWFSVDRMEGRDFDLGLHRHWVDPTIPFAERVARPAQGLLITSATLRDRMGRERAGHGAAGKDDSGWAAAESRTGTHRFSEAPVKIAVPSPFDYPRQTRVVVVTDVNRDDADQVAAAYRQLFLAAGGGAIGLFTAVSRLRSIYQRISGPLDEAGLLLLAQHVDGLDTSTLIDIFRAEDDVCLLGTDAVRDGVDVPGRALRLIVFDRVPWPRPDVLHRARKSAFGGAWYDDMLTRLRLKQAFGRLVRKADDSGVFVLLDSRMPSRLCSAFPEGVEVRRLGLAEAVRATHQFLHPQDRCRAGS